MADTQRTRSEQEMWKLPAFALVAPPAVLIFAVLLNFLGGSLYVGRLLEAYFLLGYLSPALGLLTVAILAVQYSMFWEELDFGRVGPRRVLLLSVLAIVAPAWLIVMYLVVGFGFLGLSR